MMNGLGLERAWIECMKLWKHVASKSHGQHPSVSNLKEEWIDQHGFTKLLSSSCDCFFCRYADRDCNKCPGTLIDPDFNCDNSTYRWHKHPIAFYNKLVKLNKIRKAAQRKKRR